MKRILNSADLVSDRSGLSVIFDFQEVNAVFSSIMS
jgi:hypothetical protein